MIVRNEEANLGPCLSPLKGLFHEIVVIDTGSTDRTREIAVSHGAKVVSFEWKDDFAAARNEWLTHATGDFIFWMDADDRIDEANLQRLRALLANLTPDLAGYQMACVCLTDSPAAEAAVFNHCRLYPRHLSARWEYRIHEQIVTSLEAAGMPIRETGIEIQHVGYRDPALFRRKINRNRRLLRIEFAADPNNPWTLFQLGQMHLADGQPADALTYFMKVLHLGYDTGTLLREAYLQAGAAISALNRPEEALAVLKSGWTRFPDEETFALRIAQLSMVVSDLGTAERCLQQALRSLTSYPLRSGTVARQNRRDCRRLLGGIYAETGRLAQSEAIIQEMLAETPDYLIGWLTLAYVFLVGRRFDNLEFATRQIQKFSEGGVFADVLRAERAHLQGDRSTSRMLLERAIAAAPNLPYARIAYARHLIETRADAAPCAAALRDLERVDPGNRSLLDALRSQVAEREREEQWDPSRFSFVSGPLTFT